MAYKIIVSPRAQKEIENAIDYYTLYSSNAPKSFINLLKDTYNSLAIKKNACFFKKFIIVSLFFINRIKLKTTLIVGISS